MLYNGCCTDVTGYLSPILHILQGFEFHERPPAHPQPHISPPTFFCATQKKSFTKGTSVSKHSIQFGKSFPWPAERAAVPWHTDIINQGRLIRVL